MSLISEVRCALRGLTRSRGYTEVAVLTLALAIGANTAIFSMADAIVYRPFPFPHLGRILAFAETIPAVSTDRYPVASANYYDWLPRNRALEQFAAYQPWAASVITPEGPQALRAWIVSPSFFPLLGIPPQSGRAFAPDGGEEDRHSIVISSGFWRQRLASDPNAVGRYIAVNGLSSKVIGIMPAEFDFPAYTEIWGLWMPGAEERNRRTGGALYVIGRLKSGFSLRDVRAQMNEIAGDLARRYPSACAGRGVGVMQLTDSLDTYAKRYVEVIGFAVALLLLLACANVANLQLARGAMRRREMAVHMALGAGRAALTRQLLLEGILLSLAGACLGIPLAERALALIKISLPQLVLRHLPGLPYAKLDAGMLLLTAAAAVITGIAFTVPAVLQIYARDIQRVLRAGGRGSVSSGGRYTRSALVVCEVVLAVVLLTGATLIFRGFRRLTPSRQGFDPANTLTFIWSGGTKSSDDVQTASFYEEGLRRLAALPEVSSVAAISELPALADSRSAAVIIEGQDAAPPEKPLLAETRIAAGDYFRMLSIPVLRGRGLEPWDRAGALPAAVISQSAARRFWPEHDAIGQRFRLTTGGRNTGWFTVVGIAGDVHHFFLDTEIRPTVYVSYLQEPARALNVLVRPAAVTDRSAPAVRSAMKALDPSQPLYNVRSLRQFFDDLAAAIAVIAALVGIFAVLSLGLSVAGIYAVMGYTVTERTQEIGVRMALGARSTDMWRLVIGDSLRLVAIALCFALPMALALARAMSRLFAGIVAIELFPMAGVAILMTGAAMLAAYIPARRASRVDPLVALRSQQ
jgi:putative ABC transport system permease protein